MNLRKLEQARELLEASGFYVRNLWSINDVKGKYECTDEQALEVLGQALQNEATMEQIQFSLGEFADLMNLTEKEEE